MARSDALAIEAGFNRKWPSRNFGINKYRRQNRVLDDDPDSPTYGKKIDQKTGELWTPTYERNLQNQKRIDREAVRDASAPIQLGGIRVKGAELRLRQHEVDKNTLLSKLRRKFSDKTKSGDNAFDFQYQKKGEQLQNKLKIAQDNTGTKDGSTGDALKRFGVDYTPDYKYEQETELSDGKKFKYNDIQIDATGARVGADLPMHLKQLREKPNVVDEAPKETTNAAGQKVETSTESTTTSSTAATVAPQPVGTIEKKQTPTGSLKIWQRGTGESIQEADNRTEEWLTAQGYDPTKIADSDKRAIYSNLRARGPHTVGDKLRLSTGDERGSKNYVLKIKKPFTITAKGE